ncbi:glycosyltransferase family 4 protein [Dyadobacter sp. CY323]|uniref:glycosyltransferase family 4 protein n=1 Tax=Dyadobacter sp. CY323 TaxID=2907302 RepID=UPI001F1C59AE|nr:glycosyltransferase family 4 protein [Dyadobacter sp. CY323]MCE6991390.1 glycosyltransferase family 4 protein [Dyadobacter sp. CY323]
MKKVLLSAFACDPSQGSEPGYGWNWATGLAGKGYEVHCMTRGEGRENIEAFEKPANLHFHYITLPLGLEKMYSFSQASMYLYYMIWQQLALKKGKSLHKKISFDVIHHVTWGSIQMGSFLYKIPVPFIFGPSGGGQFSPVAFKKYFGNSWKVEETRVKVSAFLLKYNPACKEMIRKAAAIWVSNPDTSQLVHNANGTKVFSTMDAALPHSFYPPKFEPKLGKANVLRLLWVGRFMPRKGHMLLLDVMENLRDYPGITLTMIGDGEQRELFEESVVQRGLQDAVFSKGKVSFSQVKHFYQQFDAFFFTSLRDSCPAQLVEAMAYGMPVVTLNLHGQAIIVNEKTGFRCACETPEQAIEALTHAILRLYREPGLLTEMSADAHAFALDQTWDQKISKITANSYPA